MALEKIDKPDYECEDYAAMAPAWTICRDVMGGTLVIRNKGDTYLPKNPKEPDKSYDRRKNRAEFIPAFEKTVQSLTGMIFRKPISFGDKIPSSIQGYMGNVDLLGNDLENFAKLLVLDGLTAGVSHFLVDYPKTTGVKTLEEERKMNFRPYWVHIKPENLVSWRHTQVGGQIVLSQVVIREKSRVASGQYGEKEQTQYRVITPTEWALLQISKNDKGEEFVDVVEKGVNSIGVISLVTVNFNPTDFMVAKPPLLELAIQNISHYNVLADHRNSLHFSGLPLLVIEEEISLLEKTADLVISADAAIRTKPGCKVYYAEHSGNALGQSRQELQDIEGRMAKSGLSMLAPNNVQDIRATQLQIEKSQNDSKLSLVAKETEKGLNLGLSYMAQWIKEKLEGPISLNKDFDDSTMSPEMISKLSDMVTRGQLSLETMWGALVKGEVLPTTFTPDTERVKIDSNLLSAIGNNGGGA